MVKIILTERQIVQLSNATGGQVTLTLTKEQCDIITKGFGKKIKSGLTKATLILTKAAREAAPFLPGGATVSATITGISEAKGAIGSVGGA